MFSYDSAIAIGRPHDPPLKTSNLASSSPDVGISIGLSGFTMFVAGGLVTIYLLIFCIPYLSNRNLKHVENFIFALLSGRSSRSYALRFRIHLARTLARTRPEHSPRQEAVPLRFSTSGALLLYASLPEPSLGSCSASCSIFSMLCWGCAVIVKSVGGPASCSLQLRTNQASDGVNHQVIIPKSVAPPKITL